MHKDISLHDLPIIRKVRFILAFQYLILKRDWFSFSDDIKLDCFPEPNPWKESNQICIRVDIFSIDSKNDISFLETRIS